MKKSKKQSEGWEKEFDKKFNGSVLIWYEAYKKDAKKYGYEPTLDFRYFKNMGVGELMLKDFISSELKKQREKIYDRWINDLEAKRFISVNPVLFWLERAVFELEKPKDVTEAKRALNFINKHYRQS